MNGPHIKMNLSHSIHIHNVRYIHGESKKKRRMKLERLYISFNLINSMLVSQLSLSLTRAIALENIHENHIA